jgi:hypothetical protein
MKSSVFGRMVLIVTRARINRNITIFCYDIINLIVRTRDGLLADVSYYFANVSANTMTLTGDGLDLGICLIVSTMSSYKAVADAHCIVSDNYHSSHPLFIMFFNSQE